MPQHPDGNPQLPVAPAGAASPPPPPPRPGLSYAAPAPILVIPPAPRSIRLGRALWLSSFVAGLAVLVGSFLTRDSHLERLRTVLLVTGHEYSVRKPIGLRLVDGLLDE